MRMDILSLVRRDFKKAMNLRTLVIWIALAGMGTCSLVICAVSVVPSLSTEREKSLANISRTCLEVFSIVSSAYDFRLMGGTIVIF